MNHLNWLCLIALTTPTVALAQGPADMMLGEPEEFEERTFSSVVRKDFNTGRYVVREGRETFLLPAAAGALLGREVRVSGLIGDEIDRNVYALDHLTWHDPTPHTVNDGAIVNQGGQAVIQQGGQSHTLTPPPGLTEAALAMLAGRSGVSIQGFLFADGELLVSGVVGRVAELDAGDEGWLSQRTPLGQEPDAGTYTFQSAIDAYGQRERLPSGTPVKITDIEIYTVADREAGEQVGSFREIEPGFTPDQLAANERLFVYVTRQDRNRIAGDPTSEGWLPLRKVEVGQTLGDVVLEAAGKVIGEQLQGLLSGDAQGAADVLQQRAR